MRGPKHIHAFFIGLAFAIIWMDGFADAWHELDNFKWDWRIPISVENNGRIPRAVSIPLKQLKETIGCDGPFSVAVVDDAGKASRLGESGGTMIPFQVTDENVVFTIPGELGAKKELMLYGLLGKRPVIRFVPLIGTYQDQQYRCFENDRMGFRVEIGPKANTTGMTVDVFGKTLKGRGLQMNRFFHFGRTPFACPKSYHELSKWGMDVLHVGPSPGLGGIYLIYKGKRYRPEAVKTVFDILEEGPVRTIVRLRAPVDIEGECVMVTRQLTLVAGDRSIGDIVKIDGAEVILDSLALGVGLRNFKEEKWVEKPREGYAYVDAKGTEPGCECLGLGVAFKPESFKKVIDIPGKEGAHIIVLSPRKNMGGLVSEHRLAAYWDKDGWVSNVAGFEKSLAEYGKDLEQKAKTALGGVERRESLAEQSPASFMALNPATAPALYPPYTALRKGAKKPKGAQTVTFAGQTLAFVDQHMKPLEVASVKPEEENKDSFKVDRNGESVAIDNGWGTWVFDSNGLIRVSRGDRELKLDDTAKMIPDDVRKLKPVGSELTGASTVVSGPVVCKVTVGKREYLLFKDRPAWWVSQQAPYALEVNVGDTKKFYYGRVHQTWNPALHIHFFQKIFELDYPADHATLFNEAQGLGITVLPTSSARRWTVRDLGGSERLFATQPENSKWPGQPDWERDGILWPRHLKPHFAPPKDSAIITAAFVVSENVKEGVEHVKKADPPMLMNQKTDKLWAFRVDVDGDGWLDTIWCEAEKPNFDAARFLWDMGGDGSAQGGFEFGETEEILETVGTSQKYPNEKPQKVTYPDDLPKKRFKTVSFFGDVANFNPDGILDSVELAYPLIRARDWTGKGELTHGPVFRGGVMSSGSWKMKGAAKHYNVAWTPLIDLSGEDLYRQISNSYGDTIAMQVFDVDGDGDQDIVKGQRDHPDSSIFFDLGDCDPLIMLVFDPMRGWGMGDSSQGAVSHTNNKLGFWGGYSVWNEGRPFVIGHHDDPQTAFSVDEFPDPTHRWYTETPYTATPGFVYEKKVENDAWVDEYHPMRIAWNLDGERRDIDGYSYVSFGTRGGRSWNAGMFTIHPKKREGEKKRPWGILYNAPINEFRDVISGKIVRAAGPYMPNGDWDGKKLHALDENGKATGRMKMWNMMLETPWDGITFVFNKQGDVHFEGISYHNYQVIPTYRHEGIPPEIPFENKFYGSPVIGACHAKGAPFGGQGIGRGNPSEYQKYMFPIDYYDYQKNRLDAEILRYYFQGYMCYFDLDGDGIVDVYLWDRDGDHIYERRIWYDKKTKNLCVSNNYMLASAYYPLSFPEAGLGLEDYKELTEIYKKMVDGGALGDKLSVKPEPLPIEGLIHNGSVEDPLNKERSMPKDVLFCNVSKKATPIYTNKGAIDGNWMIGVRIPQGDTASWMFKAEPLNAGHKYRISGWYRTDFSPRSGVLMRVYFRDAKHKNLANYAVQLKPNPSWETFAVEYSAPENAAYCAFFLDVGKNAGEAFFDGFKFEDLTYGRIVSEKKFKVQGLDNVDWRMQSDDQVPVIMGDVGHAKSDNERTVVDTSPDGFSRLLTGFARRPCLIKLNQHVFTDQVLDNVDVLLVTSLSAEKAFAPEELKTLERFVKNGGTLIMALNDKEPGAVAAFEMLAGLFDVKLGRAPMIVHSLSTRSQMAPSHFSGAGIAKWLKKTLDKRLYFQGLLLEGKCGEQLLEYDHKPLVVRKRVGKGVVYVVGAGDLISNRYASFRTRDTLRHPERFPVNNLLIDGFCDSIYETCDQKKGVDVIGGK